MRKQNMNRDWTSTARTLSEALPYMQRYSGAVVVVKFGGNAMGDDAAMAEFARAWAAKGHVVAQDLHFLTALVGDDGQGAVGVARLGVFVQFDVR